MKIHGLTVCVNKADHLDRCIDRWLDGLASFTVVTDYEDVGTRILYDHYWEREHPIHLHKTDAFTRDGATFNKGRAIEEARLKMPWEDWTLFFDCDVIPPTDWKERLEAAHLEPGHLYGCRRFQANDNGPCDDNGQPSLKGDVPGVGYFQLFHSEDVAALGAHAVYPGGGTYLMNRDEFGKATRAPLIDTHWLHAGNYDNRFMDRWRPPLRDKDYRREVPFRLAHLGERDGWWGRGNAAAFQAMQEERKRRGGRWDHERIGAHGE